MISLAWSNALVQAQFVHQQIWNHGACCWQPSQLCAGIIFIQDQHHALLLALISFRAGYLPTCCWESIFNLLNSEEESCCFFSRGQQTSACWLSKSQTERQELFRPRVFFKDLCYPFLTYWVSIVGTGDRAFGSRSTSWRNLD